MAWLCISSSVMWRNAFMYKWCDMTVNSDSNCDAFALLFESVDSASCSKFGIIYWLTKFCPVSLLFGKRKKTYEGSLLLVFIYGQIDKMIFWIVINFWSVGLKLCFCQTNTIWMLRDRVHNLCDTSNCFRTVSDLFNPKFSLRRLKTVDQMENVALGDQFTVYNKRKS